MQHQHNSTPIKISINENILKHVKIPLLYFRTSRGMVKHSFCIYFGLFPFVLENCSNFYVCHMRAMIQILQMKLWFQWWVSSLHSYWEIERVNLIQLILKWVLFFQFKTGTVPPPRLVTGLIHRLFKSQTHTPKPDYTFLSHWRAWLVILKLWLKTNFSQKLNKHLSMSQ